MDIRKLLFLVFLLPLKAHGAIALVSASSATTNNGSATSIASPSITDTNTSDLILIGCQSQFAFVNGPHFTAPSTTSGLTLATAIISTTQTGGAGWWYACTGSGGFASKTFTCNWDSAGPGSIIVEAWSGTNCTNATPSAGVGGMKACNGTSGTTAPCTQNSTTNNSWIVGNGEDANQAFSAIAGAGQTGKMAFNDSTNANAEWALIQSAVTATAGTSVTMSITNLPSGDTWNSTWLEILPLASSPATSTTIGGTILKNVIINDSTIK